jgi:Tfp pilus assembly protein PilN
MINLLPAGVKAETGYAKRNRILLRYVWLLLALAAVLAVMFGGAQVFLNQQRDTYNQAIDAKKQQLAGYKQLETQAQTANDKLKTFKALVATQSRFSTLLQDIAAHTPKGVFINSISFTSAANQAVQITATANSYNSAAGLRDALVSSSRVKGAAIGSITTNPGGSYNVTLTVAFKPGAFQ